MAYADLLKDPRWQRKRLEVLNASGWKCENCEDDTKTLHVHHKKYRRGAKPWEYEAENFQSLCEKCHSEMTESIRKLEDAVDGIKLIADPCLVDMAIGYLRTIRGLYEVEPVSIDNYEQAQGAAAAMAVTCTVAGEKILDRIVDGVFDAAAMEIEITTPPVEG